MSLQKTKLTDDYGKHTKWHDPELREHNYLRLLCASNALRDYLEADINAHEPWKTEIDEFLSALDELQA